MPFNRPHLPQLIQQIEADLVSHLGLHTPILRQSVVAILAKVLGGATYSLYGYLDFIAHQVMVDSCEADYLARWAHIWGIARKPAGFATGQVIFTGNDDAIIPLNTELQRDDQVLFHTTQVASITGGQAIVPVMADVAGSQANTHANQALQTTLTLSGVTNTVRVSDAGLRGGEESESDDSLRQRLLLRIRQPPQGGSQQDYVNWVLAVPGVTRAWCYPNHLGIGTVGVTFVMDHESVIIPTDHKVAEVQAHLDQLRPVTAQVSVFAPVAKPLELTIALNPNNAATQHAVILELNDLLKREAAPNATLRLSHLNEAIASASGVIDHALFIPDRNRQDGKGEIAVLGDITWKRM